MKRIAVAAATVVVSASAALAGDIRVPGDFRNLQDAFSAAFPGDRVLVDRGLHRGEFVLRNRDVEVVASPRARFKSLHRGDVSEPVLRVVGSDCRVRGLVIVRGSLVLEGQGNVAEECVFRGESTPVDMPLLTAEGSGTVLRANRVERSARAIVAFRSDSGGSLVVDNVIAAGRRVFSALQVRAPDVLVTGNEITFDDWGLGIEVEGDRASVEGNRVASAGITVEGDDGTLDGNEVTWTPLGSASLRVDGDRNLLRDNLAAEGSDTGILVAGDGNVLAGNDVRDNGTFLGGLAFGHGVVLRGDRNVAVDTTTSGSLAEGFRLATAWGQPIWTPEVSRWVPVATIGEGAILDGCTATGSGSCGLGNWTDGTEVTDSEFLGNGVDIVDGFGFAVFEGNDWISGGPGWTGSTPAVPDLWNNGGIVTPPGIGGD